MPPLYARLTFFAKVLEFRKTIAMYSIDYFFPKKTNNLISKTVSSIILSVGSTKEQLRKLFEIRKEYRRLYSATKNTNDMIECFN
jgi:hypothetical protein